MVLDRVLLYERDVDLCEILWMGDSCLWPHGCRRRKGPPAKLDPSSHSPSPLFLLSPLPSSPLSLSPPSSMSNY